MLLLCSRAVSANDLDLPARLLKELSSRKDNPRHRILIDSPPTRQLTRVRTSKRFTFWHLPTGQRQATRRDAFELSKSEVQQHRDRNRPRTEPACAAAQ